MKKEENSICGLDAALQLSNQIQENCQLHKALSIAIGAIHQQHEDLTPEQKSDLNADISYVPRLLNLSIEIINKIDHMSEKLTDMIFNLKPENHN